MTSIPLSRPPVDDEIKQAVLAAIDSRQYILGPQCRQLETELAPHDRRQARRADQLRHRGALADAPGARREGGRRDPGALAHRVPHDRGDLRRRGDAGLRRRRRVLHARSRATPRRRRRRGRSGWCRCISTASRSSWRAVQDLASRLGLWILEDCAQAQGADWTGAGSAASAAPPSSRSIRRRTCPAWATAAPSSPATTRSPPAAGGCATTAGSTKDVHAEIGFNLRFNELQAAAAARAAATARRHERPPARSSPRATRTGWPACRSCCRTSASTRGTSTTSTSCARRGAPSWRPSSRSAASRPASTTRSRRHRQPAGRAPGAAAAAAHRAARRRDPDPADVGRTRGRRDRRVVAAVREFFGA